MELRIKNAAIAFPDGVRPGGLLCEGGRILRITSGDPGGGAVDFGGDYLVPGLIDIHTHGAAGVDFNGATPAELQTACRFYASQGVTSFFATLLSDSPQATEDALGTLRAAMEGGAGQLAGIHLEGPFLSPDYAGAMPPQFLRDPDPALFARYQRAAGGNIRLVTLAPELPGAEAFIRGLPPDVAISLGHSGASYEQARAAFAAGARGSTHTGNAMKLLHQHFPAMLGAALEQENYCEAICDGLHLAPAFVRLLLKCKGIEKLVAVTDSLSAAGLPDGEYRLGINRVFVRGGDARLESGVRAGSTLTAVQALRNLMRFTGLPLHLALLPLTANPAREHPVLGDRGVIAPGKRADFLRLDASLRVRGTWLLQQPIFLESEARP